MTTQKAITTAIALHHEWVSMHGSFNLDRIHASMLAELRANRQWPARCTPACARETRGKLILLGKIRKVLA
jgi:hypothetical protein